MLQKIVKSGLPANTRSNQSIPVRKSFMILRTRKKYYDSNTFRTLYSSRRFLQVKGWSDIS